MRYKIYKITDARPVDFAAEELKKYLRMMMPRCGVSIERADALRDDGFCLALMQDIGLDTSEAKDTELDDIVHIDTTDTAGIIAGSNPRSVLFAVYRFLRENGCRWLYPGIDGEYIPMRDISAVKYHKMADNRYRGQCNEGAESQECMLETIDFAPKLGMNTYMLEFDNPRAYYDLYYNHATNEANREPEPVSPDTVLQWKRVCECEIEKRGLQFHDMGHGWTSEAFGIRSDDGWKANADNPVPEESLKYLAMIDGKRGLYKGVALNTNFCMSNPEARERVVKYIADYAENAPHVTYLHFWLADWQKNHCECDECRKMTPSDWYAVTLNELDAELCARELDTRISFCSYSDTTWAPEVTKINNPERFLMNMGAITRSYTYSVEKEPHVEKTPFVLNVTGRISRLEEYIVHMRDWRVMAGCPSFVYEYHFWKHQFYSPAVIRFARRIFEDVDAYRANDFDGIIEDGSQRSYFPNGFSWFVYASKLFDTSCDFDALLEDYFSHAYGDIWREVVRYLSMIDDRLDQKYLESRHSIPIAKDHYFAPERETAFLEAEKIADEFSELLEANKNMPMRVQTVSVRLMQKFAEFAKGFGKVFALKSVGKNAEAAKEFSSFAERFGAYEAEIERYYDHTMFVNTYSHNLKYKEELMQ